MLRPVIVNLVGEESKAIEGILWRARGPWLILKQCRILQINQEARPVDGEVVIERSRVHFLQVLS